MHTIMLKGIVTLLLSSSLYVNASATTSTPCPTFPAASSCQSLLPILQQQLAKYPAVDKVLKDPEKYRVQILYTQLERLEPRPVLHYYHYQVDPQKYFYPASTVKLPLAALALQWVTEHSYSGIDEHTAMLTDQGRPPQTAQHHDFTSQSGVPSIAHYIKKILLTSDNDASNRLYELLGQDYINSELKKKGLSHTLINHRLSVPFSDEDNRYVNPIRFIGDKNQLLLQLPERQSAGHYLNTNEPTIGTAYYKDGKLVNKPMAFTYKNRQSLVDFDGVIKRIVLPELFKPHERFNFSETQRAFLLEYMQKTPRSSDSPFYSESDYPDNVGKYFIFGGEAQRIPSYINYYNKNGQAYGHLIDGAYIEDQQHDIAFFLSAIIYTNENQILNDDNYETDTVGLPFMRELGQLIYQYELRLQQKKSTE